MHRASDTRFDRFCLLQGSQAHVRHAQGHLRAATVDEAEQALQAFEDSELGRRYAASVRVWRNAWAQVTPFFAFPREIRTLIYTTNAIEGLNRAVRKIIKTSTMFPTEDAARKLIWLSIQNFTQNWKRPSPKWSGAIPFFAARYGERFTQAGI